MNAPGFQDVKNSENLAMWRWRWHLQGGGKHWAARSLTDLRNDDDLRRGRAIELKRVWLRRANKRFRKVVNLAAARIERVRRNMVARRTGFAH